MVSISGRQQQLTNTTKARFLERAFCYLPVLYALAPSARRRAARKPTARNGAEGAATAAPEISIPPFSNRGVQIGIDQQISQNFEYFSCINGDFTDKYGENGGVSAKAIHYKVENDN